MRRIGEILGTCPHGVHILSMPCGFCEEETRFLRKEEPMAPNGVSQVGELIIDGFNRHQDGIKGRFPVFVGTKKDLSRGVLRFELQRRWRDGYGAGDIEQLEITMTVKPALPWWRRAFNRLFGGARAHIASGHGSPV